jgi:hypothetical protein
MHYAKVKAVQTIKKPQTKKVHVEEKKKSTARQMRPDMLLDEAFAFSQISEQPRRNLAAALSLHDFAVNSSIVGRIPVVLIDPGFDPA